MSCSSSLTLSSRMIAARPLVRGVRCVATPAPATYHAGAKVAARAGGHPVSVRAWRAAGCGSSASRSAAWGLHCSSCRRPFRLPASVDVTMAAAAPLPPRLPQPHLPPPAGRVADRQGQARRRLGQAGRQRRGAARQGDGDGRGQRGARDDGRGRGGAAREPGAREGVGLGACADAGWLLSCIGPATALPGRHRFLWRHLTSSTLAPPPPPAQDKLEGAKQATAETLESGKAKAAEAWEGGKERASEAVQGGKVKASELRSRAEGATDKAGQRAEVGREGAVWA